MLGLVPKQSASRELNSYNWHVGNKTYAEKEPPLPKNVLSFQAKCVFLVQTVERVHGKKTQTDKAHSDDASAPLFFSRTLFFFSFYPFWQKLLRNVFIPVRRWAHFPLLVSLHFMSLTHLKMSFAWSDFGLSSAQGQQFIPNSGFLFLFIHQSHPSFLHTARKTRWNEGQKAQASSSDTLGGDAVL